MNLIYSYQKQVNQAYKVIDNINKKLEQANDKSIDVEYNNLTNIINSIGNQISTLTSKKNTLKENIQIFKSLFPKPYDPDLLEKLGKSKKNRVIRRLYNIESERVLKVYNNRIDKSVQHTYSSICTKGLDESNKDPSYKRAIMNLNWAKLLDTHDNLIEKQTAMTMQLIDNINEEHANSMDESDNIIYT